VTQTIHILDLPHHEARAVIAESDAPVFLSINPVEFHGPHLSLHNDRLITAGLSRDLHRALAGDRRDYPYLVVDELEVGVEPASGPGSRHTRFRDAERIVVEACRALTELGAKRAVLNTFHGGALHNLAIDAGVRSFERAGGRAFAPLAVALHMMVDFRSEELEEALTHLGGTREERAFIRRNLQFDFHAGWLETSLALHYAPQSVSSIHRELPPSPELGRDRTMSALHRVARALGAKQAAVELDFIATAATWARLRPFPGYTTMPHLATAEAGASIARSFVAKYAEAARAVLDEGAPAIRPPFSWMPIATLGGRLDPTLVPTEQVTVEVTGARERDTTART
jgi:creatinine amidohydrolase